MHPCKQGQRNVFSFGGQDKKGHKNVKKGTNGGHADHIITNVLMKHHCRHTVSFYILSVFLGELNKTSPQPPQKKYY